MTNPQKIIVFGYSHCGTTILKSIIGHIDDVEEIINECRTINTSTTKNIYYVNLLKQRVNFLAKDIKII
jgi:hypothetical protein